MRKLGSLAALACALAFSAQSTAAGMEAFTTDGCSLFPDRSVLGEKDWCDCCLAHDLAYWRGGNKADRLKADKTLRACVVKKTNDHALAELMYLGVRNGGSPDLKTPFRWGYGWPYGRGYKALSSAEKAEARALEGSYLRQNPKLQCRQPPKGERLRANPSLKRSANGRPPGPVWRYAVHFRQPGPGVLPLSPA